MDLIKFTAEVGHLQGTRMSLEVACVHRIFPGASKRVGVPVGAVKLIRSIIFRFTLMRQKPQNQRYNRSDSTVPGG